MVLVNAMHITASVFINDDERGLHNDFKRFLDKLAPYEPTSQWRHNDTGEDNADAHLKRQLFGREVVVAVTGGKLDFGPWEQIFYGEFDGKRASVLVKVDRGMTWPRSWRSRGRPAPNRSTRSWSRSRSKALARRAPR
jgi:secondary thiamine-phosphate synthase enzyme